MRQKPKIIIIAGPNGAGKTTFAEAFLPEEAGCLNFINADLIAKGLSPFAPERAAWQAGRLMLLEIQRHLQQQESFALETTLSGRYYAQCIPKWRAKGYHVELFFLRLASPELAIARVHQRVQEGGHFIPDPTVRRRFHAGLKNLETLYKPIVNTWAIYDNSGCSPILIEEKHHDQPET